MSYYFCIVGTRDNPLYQADLASKPVGSSGPASFFSSSSNANASSNLSNTSTASNAQPLSSGAGAGAAVGAQPQPPPNSAPGGVFGFGNALGAIAGGLGGAGSGFRTSGEGRSGTTTGQASATGAPSTSTPSGTASYNANPEGKGLGFGRYNDKHVLQMIAHSSLDVVEDKQFTNNLMYLKGVDRINEWTTSAFIAPGNVKFLILHEHKHDDGIRNFFYDVWELFVKVMLNPFHDLNEPIRSQSFDAKVRASARKHL